MSGGAVSFVSDSTSIHETEAMARTALGNRRWDQRGGDEENSGCRRCLRCVNSTWDVLVGSRQDDAVRAPREGARVPRLQPLLAFPQTETAMHVRSNSSNEKSDLRVATVP